MMCLHVFVKEVTFFSLSSQCLPYSLLLQQLELKNVRELEDLLIEAVYCDIIQGKLDQRNQQVEVDCSVGRDLGPNELPNIINTLQEWSVSLLRACAQIYGSIICFPSADLASVLSQVCGVRGGAVWHRGAGLEGKPVQREPVKGQSSSGNRGQSLIQSVTVCSHSLNS